ncbi:MAG TPA: GEVED domain-containing protein, partial [Flavipsychrobacter sp.]|nr:GEVED domain-containing protein [Flavipsychrobacter sp.]
MKMKKTTQLLIPLLAFLFNARAQYQPVTLTASSYNQDVIAEGTGLPSASTTSGFDATAVASYTFPAQNYKNSAACSALPFGQGLPVNGQLIGQGQFQLASYSGANALQLTNTNPTGTFTLATPIATSNFYLLAATGNGAGTMDMTVTFSDATTEQFTAITIDDWFGGANVVFHGGRIGRNETGCGGINIAASGPNLYEFNFALSPSNHSKSIVSISFTRTNTTASELINIMGMSVAASCTSPVAGTVSSSLGSVCSGQSFNLLSTFYAGNSFQWEETPQGTTNWVAISGATSANFTKTGGQASAMDYRAVITCNSSTVTSNVITVGLNPFYDCYCSPLIGTTLHAAGNDVITNVTITGTTLNSSNGTNVNGDGYTKTSPSVAANTASLMRGAQYTITAATTNTDAVDGWIDYDGNGSFDVSEYISFSASSPSSANVTIPLSAVTGLTGMRVRYQAGTPFGASGPCTNSGDETEDYTITIVPAVNCSGAPAAATAAATSTLICPNTSFTLTASNVMIGSGIYYQWEEQPVGSSAWNVIAGATNTSHIVSAGITVATNYRMVTNCSFGSSAPSNIISVAVKPATQCYCTPLYSNGCSVSGFNARIESVTVTGAGSTAITNTNSGCSANGYGLYLGQSVNMEQGASYNMT